VFSIASTRTGYRQSDLSDDPRLVLDRTGSGQTSGNNRPFYELRSRRHYRRFSATSGYAMYADERYRYTRQRKQLQPGCIDWMTGYKRARARAQVRQACTRVVDEGGEKRGFANRVYRLGGNPVSPVHQAKLQQPPSSRSISICTRCCPQPRFAAWSRIGARREIISLSLSLFLSHDPRDLHISRKRKSHRRSSPEFARPSVRLLSHYYSQLSRRNCHSVVQHLRKLFRRQKAISLSKILNNFEKQDISRRELFVRFMLHPYQVIYSVREKQTSVRTEQSIAQPFSLFPVSLCAGLNIY